MLRNREGTPVDVVPFLVVVSLAFLVTFSFGPIYIVAVGFSFPVGVAVSVGSFLLVSAAAYDRLVRRAGPEFRAEIPPEDRLRSLVYTALALALLMILLALPLL